MRFTDSRFLGTAAIVLVLVIAFLSFFASHNQAVTSTESPAPTPVIYPTPLKVVKKAPSILCPVIGQKCQKWTFILLNNIAPGFDANQMAYTAMYPKNCYRDTNDNFVCYWTSPTQACADEMKDYNTNGGIQYITPVATKVDTTYYTCQFTDKQSNRNFVANPINYQNANPEKHCADNVSGPYRNLPDNFTYCGISYTTGQAGAEFTTTQKDLIKQVNKDNNSNKVRSDGYGFQYPKPSSQECASGPNTDFLVNGVKTCKEPLYLTGASPSPNSPEVHHVVPRRDRFSCNCGTNSMKNAGVISRQLNNYLTNSPTLDIVHSWLAATPTYPAP